MHSFQVYLPSFFRKGKKNCMETHPTKLRIHREILKFRTLPSVTDEVTDSLEKFICQLYGYKNESSVHKVRFKMFQTKCI